MKIIKNSARQGDVLFCRIARLPAEAVLQTPAQDGRHVVAHSETGHHHTARAQMAEDGTLGLCSYYQDPGDHTLAYLHVGAGGAVIEHHRAWDTHAPLVLSEGLWACRRAREYAPEGWRRVED